jgi:hypothetical protein
MEDPAVQFRSSRTDRLAIAGLGILALWLAYLLWRVPIVSRGDFLLAIMRVTENVEEDRWLDALTWPLHILGGHIVFYTRVLQLVNYYGFGYSPVFVKLAAVAAWGLVGWAGWRMLKRQQLAAGAEAATLLLLAVITFNPIPWEVLSWPDSTVPYLSSLIALLFVAPALVRVLNSHTLRGQVGLLAGLCVLVIIGSGVGWAIIPALGWVAVATGFAEGRGKHTKVVIAAVAAALALVAVAVAFFPGQLRLGLVTQSLAALPQNLGAVCGYFFSLFATVVGVSARPLASWVGGAVFAASFLVYLAYKRRFRMATEPELLFIFGVGSLALVSLGRWKLNVDRGTAVTYYHLFGLPAFYGAILMAARLLPAKAASWLLSGAAVAVALAMVPAWKYFDTQFRGQADS